MTTATRAPGRAALQEIAEGVYAYVQPDGGWCVNNAGVITDGGTTIVVDTAATEARARRLREHVWGVSPRGVDLVVNTHHHGDHVFGNAQFTPPATIVAHEQTRAEMIAAGLGLRELWPEVEWGRTPLTPPALTFQDRLTLHAGELRAELQWVGPAHTTNDVVVWLPQRRVLFAGDVVMSGVTPFCLMGSVLGSLRAIGRLRALRPEVVVSGHGPVGGPEVLDQTERYLRWVWRLAGDAAAAGLSPLAAARATDLGEFAGLRDPERLVCNLRRAFVDRSGSPLGAPVDVLAGFREMVGYHGRLPDCHA